VSLTEAVIAFLTVVWGLPLSLVILATAVYIWAAARKKAGS
jgi:hypothetical protein